MIDLNIWNIINFYTFIINYSYSYNDIWNIIFLFFLWIIFWSFLTMLIYRLFYYEKALYDWDVEESTKIMKTILYGRSYCPVCKETLKPLHLFPLFSYIFLRWKCAYCWTKIPISYFLIEILLWILFVLFFLYFMYIWLFNNINIFFLIPLFLLIVILYGLLLYDIKYLYLSSVLNNIWFILSGILFLIWFIINYKLWIFLAIFIILWILFFFFINGLAKLYFWIKIWFKNVKNIELIGLGDFYALPNILLFMGYIIWYKNLNYISHINIDNMWYIISFLFSLILLLGIYIFIASIVTILYYWISIIIWYKNKEQINTEKELKDSNINSPIVPFLPWLIIASFLIVYLC